MKNKIHIVIILILILIIILMGLKIKGESKPNITKYKNYKKAPVIYVDHGSPMRLLEKNDINNKLEELGKSINDKVKGVIVISAHNLSYGTTYISNLENIEIIYDFYGFPQEMYNQKYNARGDIILSNRLSKDIEGSELNKNIKNDHGAWTIMKKLFPSANKPMAIITIDMELSEEQYYEIGKRLKKYRDEGYLIIASGSILHNFALMERGNPKPQKWAQDFNNDFLNRLSNNQYKDLVNYNNLKDINKAFKSKDHYVPIIYALGAIENNEKVNILSKEITEGSLSNNLIVFGEY